VLSTFTTHTLRPYIVTEAARRGIRVLPTFCYSNQLEFQGLNSESDLYRSEPDVIVIATLLEEAAPNLVWRYAALSPADVELELQQLQQRLDSLLQEIRLRTKVPILLFNFAGPHFTDAGIADAVLEVPQEVAVATANNNLSALIRKYASVFVFDCARVVAEVGLENAFDRRLYYTASIPFSVRGQLCLGRHLGRYLRALLFPPCKCLVVDLDNTLWAGVLGEDGPKGIKLTNQYPGSVYRDLQRRLLSLRDQGVLLAIASKNNEADVREVFEQHPSMILSLRDFAAAQIHWGDKADSLRAIAAELNIGLDALAFLDDSPVERALIRQYLPEVSVIDVPTDPLGLSRALEVSGVFDRLIVSAEDRRRASMAEHDRRRSERRARANNLDEFLRQLEMRITIDRVESKTLPRVVQLMGKTNQFNLTSRRHTAADVEAMINAGSVALWMRVRDCFDDNGIVGVATAVPETNTQWRIDTFLLSCRVIGRRLETALLAALAECVGKSGGTILVGEYIPTAKNGQCAEFYRSHGFQPLDGSRWTFDLRHSLIEVPDFIRYEDRVQ
jgi:FkbH-like protein